MERISSALARIQEIQNRVEGLAPAQAFSAHLDAHLEQEAAEAGTSALQSVTPSEARPITIGELIGAQPVAAGTVRIEGIASQAELAEYLRVTGFDDRNGRLASHELVAISGGWGGRAGNLAAPAADAWETMREAAAADGVELLWIDGYRSWEIQHAAHQRHVNGEKREHVLPAGTSQHGLGLAIDLTDGGLIGPGDPAWHWMQSNARSFGWHPISNESWHWEFRGV